MKKLLAVLALAILVNISASAQGLVIFSSATQKTSTNSIAGGAATGSITGAGNYYFGLFVSTTASDVNGLTSPTIGNANNNYAFNDSRWQFVGYATNTSIAGRFFGGGPGIVNSEMVVSGVPGSSLAKFVIIGWSANIGANISAVQSWYNNGYPTFPGYIGQSVVSGLIQLGDGGSYPSPTLCGSLPPLIPGFVLGMAGGFLYSPAYITSQPASQTVSVGGSTTFVARAYGDSSLPFSYQWKLNGTNISASGNYSMTVTNITSYIADFALTVNNVQLSNGGNYSVFVSNAAGSATSSNALLTVSGAPPVITLQPTNVSTVSGANVVLTVSATGSIPLNYQWSLNTTNILNATNATLSFINVQVADSGNYSVNLTNNFGSTNSVVAVLSVLPGLPPLITAQPLPQIVAAGNTATFTVGVSATAPLSYQWLLNGTNLSGATNAALNLSNVQTNLIGTYSVAISNPYGATNSLGATLAVIQPAGRVFFITSPAGAGAANPTSTRIYTNSTVGGGPAGMTCTNGAAYLYALYASPTVSTVNGQSAAILGAANNNYAFNDANWTLVAYGTNTYKAGRLAGASPDVFGQTFVPGVTTYGRFVVIGWSANIGNNISAVQSWFNNGAVASDGWIGQSAVSGLVLVGDGALLPTPRIFDSNPPYLQGFTLGLASPVASKSYALPYAPLILKTLLKRSGLQLNWPLAAGAYSVQAASAPGGPWSDLSLSITDDGTTASADVPITEQVQYFRLIVQ